MIYTLTNPVADHLVARATSGRGPSLVAQLTEPP